jgi:hypothetical protein
VTTASLPYPSLPYPSVPAPLRHAVVETPRAAAPARDEVTRPATLVASLDEAAQARALAPALRCVAVAVVVGVALLAGWVVAVVAAVLVVGVLAVVGQNDRTRRTVPAVYGAAPARHERLVAAWERHRVASTDWEPAVWEVGPAGAHRSVVRRVDGPRHLRADVALPTFAGRDRDVAFLPDRVVVRDGRHHHVAPYEDLQVATTVCERAEGGRLGRLSLRIAGSAGVAATYDLVSVAAAGELAAALRGLGASTGC